MKELINTDGFIFDPNRLEIAQQNVNKCNSKTYSADIKERNQAKAYMPIDLDNCESNSNNSLYVNRSLKKLKKMEVPYVLHSKVSNIVITKFGDFKVRVALAKWKFQYIDKIGDKKWHKIAFRTKQERYLIANGMFKDKFK